MRHHGRRVPIHLPPTTVYSDSQLEVVSSASNSLASDYVFQGHRGGNRSLTKTSRKKKQFQRAPGLQAALDRIQQRRAQDEPSVLLKDDEPKEMGELLELFSKYDTILDHLVKKNEGLRTYAHGETEEQSFTTVDVLETLEQLRMKREETLGHHDESTAYDRSRSHSRSPHAQQIVGNREARNRVSQQQRYQSHLSPLSTETYSNIRIIPREIQVEGREPSMEREGLPDRHSRRTNIASERFPSRVESRSTSRYTSDDASKSLGRSQRRYDMDSEVQILGESKPRQFHGLHSPEPEKRDPQAWQGDPLSRPRRESPYDEKAVPKTSTRFPNDTKPRYGATPSHTLGQLMPEPGRSKSEARDRQTTSRWGHNRKNTALRDPPTSPSRASSPPQVTFNRRMDPASSEPLASRKIRDLGALRRQQVADRRAGSQERPIIDVKSDGFSLGLGAARRQLVAESRFESQERPIVDVESEDFSRDLDYWRRQKVVGNDKVYASQEMVIDLSADEYSDHSPLNTEESRMGCLPLSPSRKEADASNLPHDTIFADDTLSEVSSLNPSEKARRLKSHVDVVYNYSRRLHSSQETLKGDLLDFKKRYHDRNESLYERALQSSGTANSERYPTEMGSIPERSSNFVESEDDRLRMDMEVSPCTPLASRGYQSEKGVRQPEDPAGRKPTQSREQAHKAVLMREHAERISVALSLLKSKRKSSRTTFASENTDTDTSNSSHESDWTDSDVEVYPIAQSKVMEYPDAPAENELIKPPKYNVRARLRGMRSTHSLVSSSDSVSTRDKTTGILQKKVLSKVQTGEDDKNTVGEVRNNSVKETSDDLTMPNLVLVDNSGACPPGVGKVMRWDAPCGVPCGLAKF
jgi:hypothetical protein